MTTFDRGASELERAAFVARASSLGLENVGPFHWYHVIDLGDALVTPGQFDYRESLDSFGFDTDYTGRTVLDVGSATGFFAFEFERRGASVTSLEIASLDQIDRFPGQTPESVIRRILHVLYGHDPERLARETSESLYRNLLTGPFDLCRQRLASKVDRAYLPVYDLSLERLGIKSGFDLVFVSDILWHTINPLQALAAAASVCADRIMIVQPMPSIPGSVPALVFDANDTFGADEALVRPDGGVLHSGPPQARICRSGHYRNASCGTPS